MMVSPDRRDKLAELLSASNAKVQAGSDWATKQSRATTNRAPKIVPLKQAAPGKVIRRAGATYYHIRRSLRAVWPEASTIMDHYQRALFGSGQALADGPRGRELGAIVETGSGQVIYLDIETCGFSGTPIFLIGWLWYDGAGDFIIEQVLARDYAEEAGMLHAVGERFKKTRIMLTYNGKRFDLPSIRERGVIHRTAIKVPAVHIDLLDHARHRWKTCLPDCRLQTVETHLCRRYRTGDIPSSQIPEVYHEFVRTGDARKLSMVIRHNLLDVVTLAEITAHLIAGTDPGE